MKVKKIIQNPTLAMRAAMIMILGIFMTLCAAVTFASPAEAVTITLRVDTTTASDYDGPNPVVKTGTSVSLDSAKGDFTPGEPLNTQPTEWNLDGYSEDDTEANINNEFKDYVSERLADGYGVEYRVGSRTGAIFDWYSSPAPTSNTTIYAVFTSTKYTFTVVYNNDDGTPSKSYEVSPNSTISETMITNGVSLTKRGYSFNGWKTSDGKSFNFSQPITKSMTITPDWQPADVTEIPPYDPAADLPHTISGSAHVKSHWYDYSTGSRVSKFDTTILSDGGCNVLAGKSAVFHCLTPTAAIPTGTFSYVATFVSSDPSTGMVTYNVRITPPGAAHIGGPSNSLGLIGYQEVGGQISVWVNMGGYAQIQKVSAQTSISNNNNMYSLAGAVFELINSKGQVAARLTTGDDGWTPVSELLPAGTYTVHEADAPDGFTLAPDTTIEIKAGETKQLAFSDEPERYVPGEPFGSKDDQETGLHEPQGDAELSEAVFCVKYYDTTDEAATLNMEPKCTWYIKTGSDGYAYLDNEHYLATFDGKTSSPLYVTTAGHVVIPAGTVTWQEVKSPTGYHLSNDEPAITTLPLDGVTTEHSMEALTFKTENQIYRGGLSIQKFASEVSDGTINQSTNGTFDDINLASTLLISNGETPLASPEAISAASATAVDPQRFIEMVLTAAGENKAIGSESFGMKNNENQTTASDDMATAQAGAMFKGAQITVYNSSPHHVNIIGKGLVEPGDVVTVLTLDENGYASTGNRDLPYGTYTLKETKAPEGYHLNTTWTKTVQVHEEGVIVEVGDLPEDKTGFSGVDDQVIRGDYKFVKNAADSQNTLPYTPFLIVNLQSGENHVIVTNENGEFYSSSYVNGNAYNLHSNNTNANDDAITWNEDGTYTIDDTKLDVYAGVWFTGYGPLNDPNNVLAPRVDPNDNLGAFPYGDYAVIELMADANSGYENVVRTFTITREGFEINGGTITDEWKNIELKTTAKDAVTGTNHGSIENDTTTIIDTVEFSEGLRANETYTFTGVLMDKATNEAITDNDGNEITASAQHLVTEDEAANGGTVDVEFADIPTELLRGKVTVVFEDCYDEAGTWIASHADIDDEGQTVYYPEIHTTATDNVTGQHEGDATSTDTVTINDVVDYNGLQPGKTYTMTGTLMDKETGKAFEGVEPVSTEFTPEESDGSVTMTFEVPAELLRGKTTVVFENCYLDEAEVAVHADIDDEGQTVSYPDIHTTATDGLDGDKTFSGQQTVTLVDTVEYSNLTPGVEYTMTGTLMDKETGALVEGVEPVSQTFTPETADGTMEMTFTFNVVDLVGHDIVVFENCYRDFDASGELIQVAQHADINDEGQTVNVRDAGLADDFIDETPLAQTGENSNMLLVTGFTVMLAMASILIAGVSRANRK